MTAHNPSNSPSNNTHIARTSSIRAPERSRPSPPNYSIPKSGSSGGTNKLFPTYRYNAFMLIRPATETDLQAWHQLRIALWPDYTSDYLLTELREILASPDR